jgi:hypothetical protein
MNFASLNGWPVCIPVPPLRCRPCRRPLGSGSMRIAVHSSSRTHTDYFLRSLRRTAKNAGHYQPPEPANGSPLREAKHSVTRCETTTALLGPGHSPATGRRRQIRRCWGLTDRQANRLQNPLPVKVPTRPYHAHRSFLSTLWTARGTFSGILLRLSLSHSLI